MSREEAFLTEGKAGRTGHHDRVEREAYSTRPPEFPEVAS